MANATYVRTDLIGSGETKSIVVVQVDEVEVQVQFWNELIEQWGKDGVKSFVEAEALWALGFHQDSHDKLSLVTDEWGTRWISEHPIPVEIPVTDLLG